MEEMERLTSKGTRGVCDMSSTEFCIGQENCYVCSHGREVFKRLWDVEKIIFSADGVQRITLEALEELVKVCTAQKE